MNELEIKVHRLEQRLAWSRVQNLVILGILAIVTLGGMSRREAERVVEAEQFVVRDSMGRKHATLGLGPDGPGLVLWAGDQMRSMLSAQKDGAVLMMYDGQGRQRASFNVADAGGTITFTNERNKFQITIGATTGNPTIQMFDKNEAVRASLGLLDGTDPMLRMSDEKGKIRLWCFVNKDRGTIELQDDAEQPGLTLTQSSAGSALAVADRGFVQALVSVKDKTPKISFFNQQKELKAQFGLTSTGGVSLMPFDEALGQKKQP